jgi:hypothetical protein
MLSSHSFIKSMAKLSSAKQTSVWFQLTTSEHTCLTLSITSGLPSSPTYLMGLHSDSTLETGSTLNWQRSTAQLKTTLLSRVRFANWVWQPWTRMRAISCRQNTWSLQEPTRKTATATFFTRRCSKQEKMLTRFLSNSSSLPLGETTKVIAWLAQSMSRLMAGASLSMYMLDGDSKFLNYVWVSTNAFLLSSSLAVRLEISTNTDNVGISKGE